MKKNPYATKISRLYIGIFMFLLLFPALSLAEGWIIYRRASIKNQTKDVLQFENLNNKGLFIRLIVHNRKVSLKGKPPLYQVDQGEVHNLKDEKSLKTAKLYWLRFKLAENEDDRNTKLLEILNGKKLVFQYYPSENIIKEAVFNLEGIKEQVQILW